MPELVATPALSVRRFGFYTSGLMLTRELGLVLAVWARYRRMRSVEELLPGILQTVGE